MKSNKKYWVVGGHYTDTDFVTLMPKCELEKHGPFRTYKEAYIKWSEQAWRTVDICCYRVMIEEKNNG